MITFKSFRKKTIAIDKSLQEFAKSKGYKRKDVDFELDTFETLLRQLDTKEDTPLEDTQQLQEETLRNKNIRIYQKYTITVLPSELDISPFQIALLTNADKTKVVGVIKKGSIFQRDEKLKEKIKKYIWHKKLLSSLLIDIFEDEFHKQLEKLLEVIPYAKPLPKDIKFTVAKALAPGVPTDAKIALLYQQNEQSYIEGVKENTLLIRYTKPKEAQGGRNCEGKYIPAKKAKSIPQPLFDTETIYVDENENELLYYAKKEGFVSFENNTLAISNTLKLNKADFKSTGDLAAGDTDKNISVEIVHTDGHEEDAIGSGLKVEVKELNVDGSIGSGVEVNAQDLKIDAQTHRQTTIEVANTAEIKLHRGDLSANEAKVDILETGKVQAKKSIHITKMVGGEAIAPEVYVQELGSNATIIASKKISIGSFIGTNSSLIIDPNAIESYHTHKQELQNNLKKLQEQYQNAQEMLEEKLRNHAEQIERIKTFQQRILKAQKSGKTPMKQDVIRVKEYKRTTQKLQEQKVALETQEEEIATLQAQLDKLLEYDMHATIESKSAYDGHIKVSFISPKNSEETSAFPEGIFTEISLTCNEEGERVIRYVHP